MWLDIQLIRRFSTTTMLFLKILMLTVCQLFASPAHVFIDDIPNQFRVMNFYESANGKFFSKLGNTLATQTAQTKTECSFKCLQNHDCLSVNVFDLAKTVYQCELLNWTGTVLDKYLTNRADTWLMQREVRLCWCFLLLFSTFIVIYTFLQSRYNTFWLMFLYLPRNIY